MVDTRRNNIKRNINEYCPRLVKICKVSSYAEYFNKDGPVSINCKNTQILTIETLKHKRYFNVNVSEIITREIGSHYNLSWRNHFRVQPRSSPSEVFLGKVILEICSRFTGEHP